MLPQRFPLRQPCPTGTRFDSIDDLDHEKESSHDAHSYPRAHHELPGPVRRRDDRLGLLDRAGPYGRGPRGRITAQHAALWVFHRGPVRLPDIIGEKPDGNVAIDTFAHFYDAIDRGGSTRTAAYHIRRDEADPLNSVIVVEPNGRSWHIHREDADHRHHDMPHRLAAGWFGDRSA